MLENKELNQKFIFDELISAKNKGYITDIQAILKMDEDNKICYNPDQVSTIDDIPSTIIQNNVMTDENIPPCSEIFIKFTETISDQAIEEVSKYLETKYGCKSNVYPNKRMDLYSFK
jgi:hypothetical protein